MSTAAAVDALLADAARENSEAQEAKARDSKASSEARDPDRRHDHADRHADRHDRAKSRDRGDRHRESNGGRRRSRDRDHRHRDGSRPRSSKGGADTEEDRNRARRSSSRDRYRGGRRDRGGGDYYSGGGRARSRSPRRDRGEDRFVRTRSPGPRDRRRNGGGGADERRPSRRDNKTPEPEVTEDDRDKRTIFVQQISQRAETRHLRSFFEAIGPVVEAQIVKDRVTGRSKG